MTNDDTRQEEPAQSITRDGEVQEKKLTEVCVRFADLCQYFSQQNMDLPPQIVEEVRLVSKLSVDDRTTRMNRLNQELTKYLNQAGPDPQTRQ